MAPTGSLVSRKQALDWMLANSPEAKAAWESVRTESDTQAHALYGRAVAWAQQVGSLHFVWERDVCWLPAADVGSLFKLDTRALNKQLEQWGLIQRDENGKRVVSDGAHPRSQSERGIVWSVIGLAAIWEKAAEAGLVDAGQSKFLEKMESKLPWLVEWKMIREASDPGRLLIEVPIRSFAYLPNTST